MKMFVVCTHALCTLHARIVQTARTHCARCTPALCKLDARTVYTARTHARNSGVSDHLVWQAVEQTSASQCIQSNAV